MENEANLRSVSEIGQRLHVAETAIGIGRRSVAELLQQVPVDIEAVEATRQAVAEARLERNQLRAELERARPVPKQQATWLQ
jgi:hypothetical protein